MDVYLMIQRQKTTIFTDTRQDTSIYDLKDMLSYIVNVPPKDQRLYYNKKLLDDGQTLSDYGVIASTAKAQCPATIGLTFRKEDGNFETLKIEPFSTAPDLPSFMKQDSPESSSETG